MSLKSMQQPDFKDVERTSGRETRRDRGVQAVDTKSPIDLG